MLSKVNRLTKKNDFDFVFKNGKSEKKGLLIFKFLKNNLGSTRIGFIVSKKISNKASVRNKVKRRLRYIIQKQLRDKKKSLDIIIVALSGIEKRDFLETEETATFLLKKIIN
ncbi:MAG: ribonuclease P protein component [Candidatus Staskawiczbacteria bacterium]|nr:ribonuclease P protein component [Candidatus Staskawiczbacteria bacterium]